MWAITVMWFWIKGFLGCLGVVISVTWVLQVLLYVFISPPATPFLNTMFTKLDKAFGLFGTLAFAIYCFYLIRALSSSASWSQGLHGSMGSVLHLCSLVNVLSVFPP